MRVVLDTNVLLSACLKPDGLEAQVVNMVLGGLVTACVTDHVLAEYEDVLSRPKFESVRPRAAAVLAEFAAKALRVPGGDPLSIAADEDDNRFLECAASASASYLITGNLRHFPPKHNATDVVNARSFVTIYGVPAIPPALE